MSNTKHTPGPWKQNPIPGYEREVRVVNNETEGRKFICLANSNPLFKKGEAEANAKLIAAAPELLEALKEAIIDLRTAKAVFSQNSIANEIQKTLNKIESAYRKATE